MPKTQFEIVSQLLDYYKKQHTRLLKPHIDVLSVQEDASTLKKFFTVNAQLHYKQQLHFFQESVALYSRLLTAICQGQPLDRKELEDRQWGIMRKSSAKKDEHFLLKKIPKLAPLKPEVVTPIGKTTTYIWTRTIQEATAFNEEKLKYRQDEIPMEAQRGHLMLAGKDGEATQVLTLPSVEGIASREEKGKESPDISTYLNRYIQLIPPEITKALGGTQKTKDWIYCHGGAASKLGFWLLTAKHIVNQEIINKDGETDGKQLFFCQ